MGGTIGTRDGEPTRDRPDRHMTDGARRDARHARILAGVGAVVREHGIDEVSLARVADTTGVSISLLQHYHRTPRDLLIGAVRAARTDVLDRVDQLITLAERNDTRVGQMLIDVLSQLLPLSPRRVDEVALTHAVAEFADDGDGEVLDAEVDALHSQLQQRVAAALEDGKLCGEVDPALDSESAATDTLHLVDGLAERLLADQGPERTSWATDSLTAAVAALCPGECFHGADFD